MGKYGNENAAAGGRSKNTADRDRTYGGGGGFGGGSGNGGGMGGGGYGNRSASVIGNRFGAPSASAQAAAQKRNAPTNGPLGGMNPNHYGGRRTTNPTQSYEMSLHNMVELGKMMPGPMMGLRGLGAALGIGGPQFSGSTGMVNGPGDYDGPNRFGLPDSLGLLQRMALRKRGLQRGF